VLVVLGQVLKAVRLTHMVISQYTHRQPAAVMRYPPATGPMQGPRSGPMAQAAIALPRFSTGIISAMLPLPMVIGTDPDRPMRKRKAMSIPMESESAAPTEKMANKTFPVW
jgi:hypothetical protein